jgi:hypothetical protein
VRANETSAAPITVLLVGDFQRAEFRAARAELVECAEAAEFADVQSAVAALEAGLSAAIIVVAQAFPGQFPHRDIDRLRRAAPLARFIALLGSLCEGEHRSGTPWPATARVYWHQWTARCRRQLAALVRGEPCSWSLPATAAEEERLLADAAAAGIQNAQLGGAVVIRTRQFEIWDWLRATCRRRGLAAVWQRGADAIRLDGVSAALFDADELDSREMEELRRFAAAMLPAPTIALLSFPRIEDRDRAISAGAEAAVSKPFVEAELFAELLRR